MKQINDIFGRQSNQMCCVTLTRATLHDLFHASPPTFVIPIFRAPAPRFPFTRSFFNFTTAATTTITPTESISLSSTINTSTTQNRILAALLKHEQLDNDFLTVTSSTMINQHVFENLILTNTIVAAFCIVLMITLTGFLLFLLIPSIRRRFLKNKSKEEIKIEEPSSLSHQSSFHHFTLGPSRLNPLFEAPAGTTTTTTTQFGTLFHPHTTATTLLHPTFWTPVSPASLVSTPVPNQQSNTLRSSPMSSIKKPLTAVASTSTSSLTSAGKPPLDRKSVV